MTAPDDRGPLGDAEARLSGALRRALDAAAAASESPGDDEAVLRALTRMAERLRQAMIGMSEMRGAVALRMRDRLPHLSYARLGDMMSVTRARAQEIIGAARKKAGLPDQPEIALAVVTSPAGVLICKRADGSPPWTFPGGEVEPGESAEQGAVREVAEETGLAVTAGRVIGRRTHPATSRRMVYVACPLEGTPPAARVRDPGELVAARWADLTDARLLMPSMDERVSAYLERELR